MTKYENTQFERTANLLSDAAIDIFKASHVAVFGIGGVGGHAVDALVRAGIGEIDLIDNDTVSLTNINRQLIATHSTIGKYKVDAMAEHIKDINPSGIVNTHKCFLLENTKENFDFSKYDYVIDAVDTVSAKLIIIEECHKAGTPVISAMGAGNKLNPCDFEVSDISKTSVCPLAKVMRRELKKRNIENVKVVYSKEQPRETKVFENGKPIPASISFVPSVMGLIMAGEVLKSLST